MSNTEDYNAKLEVLKAIPDADALEPIIPIDVFLQEAEDLYHWSLDDAEALQTLGITGKLLQDLPVRTGACREAQSLWNKDFHSQQEAQKQWSKEAPEAYELRNDLLHALRYAYRKDPALPGRVSAIAAGNGHADLIQDLNDISVLGKANPEPLTTIGFDLTQLDLAAARADELAGLLAEANGDKAQQNATKVLRDKAYTHLKELVDEIREAGRYIFRKDPTRKKGYSSMYWKKLNRKKKESESQVAE